MNEYRNVRVPLSLHARLVTQAARKSAQRKGRVTLIQHLKELADQSPLKVRGTVK